jgi:hypothetical protein
MNDDQSITRKISIGDPDCLHCFIVSWYRQRGELGASGAPLLPAAEVIHRLCEVIGEICGSTPDDEARQAFAEFARKQLEHQLARPASDFLEPAAPAPAARPH